MKSLCLLAAAGLLAGCAAVPPAPLASDPSSPVYVLAVSPAYSPVTAGYVARRPAEPEDWADRNRRVAPGGPAR